MITLNGVFIGMTNLTAHYSNVKLHGCCITRPVIFPSLCDYIGRSIHRNDQSYKALHGVRITWIAVFYGGFYGRLHGAFHCSFTCGTMASCKICQFSPSFPNMSRYPCSNANLTFYPGGHSIKFKIGMLIWTDF